MRHRPVTPASSSYAAPVASVPSLLHVPPPDPLSWRIIANYQIEAFRRVDECVALWLLKNSSTENSRKIHRARMPYKRFSRTGEKFSITGLEAVCAENEFFNSHPCMRQLTPIDIRIPDAYGLGSLPEGAESTMSFCQRQ